MTQIVLPILIALLIWWTTTGIVFYLVRMPAHTYRYSMAGVTLIV